MSIELTPSLFVGAVEGASIKLTPPPAGFQKTLRSGKTSRNLELRKKNLRIVR